MSVCNLNHKDIKSMINKILLRFRTKKIVSEYRETTLHTPLSLLVEVVKNNLVYIRIFNWRQLNFNNYVDGYIRNCNGMLILNSTYKIPKNY